MNLSEEQARIVNAPESQIAVIGPPGTGKTRVLTERIKALIENGVEPKDITAITFTNFAANEMKARLPSSASMFIGTMHSYAARILIDNGISVNIAEMVERSDFSELIHKVNNSDDLKLPHSKYLFVDEVQDLCDYEFHFIMKLPYDNIFLGGDADQCIYQFKGAKPQLFNNYCLSSSTTTYTLTHNYRCGQNIIEFAEYFMLNMPNRIPIQVTGNLIDRGWVSRVDFNDALFELYNNRDYGKWFILTRTNAELEEAGRQLKSFNIPYTSFKQGDFTNEEIEKFLKNDEVKLLTIHSAKGLEMDNVIVIGARNWNGEEKCIEYVAATRAKRKLFWCPSIAMPKRNVQRKKATKPTRAGISWE